MLVTVGKALLETLTTRVIVDVDAAARALLREQVTTCPAAPHVQPLPAADTYPRLAGSVSVTVISPFVANGPRLVTVSVYVPSLPTVKGPKVVFPRLTSVALSCGVRVAVAVLTAVDVAVLVGVRVGPSVVAVRVGVAVLKVRVGVKLGPRDARTLVVRDVELLPELMSPP